MSVTFPAVYSTVAEPVALTWQARGFAPAQGGRFAVFLDRDPMPPGRGLEYFDPQDRQDIWVLGSESLRLDHLPQRVGVDPAERNHHDVTVVLLDASGRRVGEYAGFTEFTVRR